MRGWQPFPRPHDTLVEGLFASSSAALGARRPGSGADNGPASYRWNSLLKRTIKASTLGFSWVSVPAPTRAGADGVPQAPGTRYKITVPEIEAEMDGPQFAIVLAVVRKVLLAPPPRQRVAKEAREEEKEKDKDAAVAATTPSHRRGGRGRGSSSFGSAGGGSSYFASGWLRGLGGGRGVTTKPGDPLSSPTLDVDAADDDNAVDGGGAHADADNDSSGVGDASGNAMASLSVRMPVRTDSIGDAAALALPPVPRRQALKQLVRAAMQERETRGTKSMAMEADARRGGAVVEGEGAEAKQEAESKVQKLIEYTFGVISWRLRKGSGGGDQLALVIQSLEKAVGQAGDDEDVGGGGGGGGGGDGGGGDIAGATASRSRRAAVVRSRKSDAFLRSVAPRHNSDDAVVAAVESHADDVPCGVKGKHVFYRDGSGEVHFELSSATVENLRPGAAATQFEDATVVLRPVSDVCHWDIPLVLY